MFQQSNKYIGGNRYTEYCYQDYTTLTIISNCWNCSYLPTISLVEVGMKSECDMEWY